MEYRILIVEDDADTREILACLLESEVHHVDRVASGDEALDLLADRAYDVIMSDFHMPNMDGGELYRQIEHRWPHLAPRVVLATAEAAAAFGPQNRRGPRLVLRKPYTLERVRQMIARVIARNA